MIVADGSLVLDAMLDDGRRGDQARRRLADTSVHAPHLLDVEVAGGLRRLERAGHILPATAERVIAFQVVAPIARYDPAPFLGRIWELRDNFSAYDAAYVALAEALGAPLATTDARLVGAPGARCDIELVGADDLG